MIDLKLSRPTLPITSLLPMDFCIAASSPSYFLLFLHHPSISPSPYSSLSSSLLSPFPFPLSPLPSSHPPASQSLFISLLYSFVSFNNYRIPRENLLNKVGDVTPDGRYSSPYEVIQKYHDVICFLAMEIFIY